MMKKIVIFAFTLCAFLMNVQHTYAWSLLGDEKKIAYPCGDLQDRIPKIYAVMIQGYNGWFYKSLDFDAMYRLNASTDTYMQEFQKALAAKDIQLVVFSPLLPKTYHTANYVSAESREKYYFEPSDIKSLYTRFNQRLSEMGILTTDVSDVGGMSEEDLFFKTDIHWRPEGARLTAQKIAQVIKADKAYNDIAKIDVNYKKLGAAVLESEANEVLKIYCNSEIPRESSNIYDFEYAVEASADALFGDDASIPSIALVGSSFSAVKDYYFNDFLEDELSASIANYAIGGGGLYTAIVSYLSSNDFIENKPKYLIWEVAGRYDLNQDGDAYFRQMIPSVYGECRAEDTLANTTISLSANDKPNILLEALETLNVTGSDYYFQFKTDEKALSKFKIEFEYEDGDGEYFEVDRGGRYINSGHFFVELSKDINSKLSRVTIENPKQVEAKLDVKLCRKSN